jgi:hypothetical protein
MIGLGVIGGGVALTGVGLLFGAQANSKWGKAQDAGCNDDGDCPTQAGLKLIDDANGKAKLSTIFVGLGLAAAAGGVVLYLTAPKSGERKVAITTSGNGLLVWGTF